MQRGKSVTFSRVNRLLFGDFCAFLLEKGLLCIKPGLRLWRNTKACTIGGYYFTHSCTIKLRSCTIGLHFSDRIGYYA